jgi:DNA polymerase-1
MPDGPTLYLIDSHSLIYRMFHAVAPMTAPDGRPTNATFGVTRDLLTICDDYKPTYLVCTFDVNAPTFRDEIYTEYKKNRPPAPDDLVAQIPAIHEVMEAMNLPILEIPGFEADDVIATVATSASARGIETYLCTNDKDCRQLIDGHVRMLDMRKQKLLDREGVIADWGISPEQVVDFQSLVGDSVDNVPGVAGVGEKTAAKLLQQYGTLDNLVAHVDEIKQSKLKENLLKAIQTGDLERSRQLVRLDTQVPLNLDWENWHRKPWNGQRLLTIFEDLGFRTFANRVRSSLTQSGRAKNAALLEAIGGAPVPKKSAGNNQGSLFGDPEESTPVEEPVATEAIFVDNWKTDYTIITTDSGWQEFLQQLKKQKRFAFDLETTGLDPLTCDIIGYAFSWEAEKGTYVAVRGPVGDTELSPERVLADLKPIFEDPTIAKVNQNIKFDQTVLKGSGVALQGVAGDSMIAHYLLHSADRAHNLDELTRKYFHHENISITALIGKGKNQKRMDEVPVQKVGIYASEDADAAWRLTERFEPELEAAQLGEIYRTLEIPLIDVLAEMETTGIRLDTEFLNRLSGEMGTKLAAFEEEIHTLVGKKFNIASVKQLREVMFDELKLPVLKRTGLTREASTNQETLEKLAAQGHAVPKAMIDHRQISKLKGTYVDALPALVSPKTGRLHTSFNQTVAATGRLSSSDPNLQNVPTRTEMGREIRQAFVPQEGWKLLTADYSQIELRMLAHFSQDANLQAAYLENKDIHTLVAAEIFGVEASLVSSEMRRIAKTVNFGIIYGMSAFGLAARLGLDRKEAEKFIRQYFDRYPNVLTYQDDLLKACRRNGYVSSILGRKRRFDPGSIRVKSSYHGRNQAEREAINMEIQGSAADLIKLAMLKIHHRLRDEKRQARMLLSVHDELVFEVPPEEIDLLARLVRHEMIHALKLNVPLEVDVSVGKNWLEVEEMAF